MIPFFSPPTIADSPTSIPSTQLPSAHSPCVLSSVQPCVIPFQVHYITFCLPYVYLSFFASYYIVLLLFAFFTLCFYCSIIAIV